MNGERYGIGELAELAGVSRRTVRYYVQEGLLPAPLGLGRGRHYERRHLERLLEVKGLQERGVALDEIRRGEGPAPGEKTRVNVGSRTAWIRFELAPGIELNVAAGRRIPSASRLAEIAELCREAFEEI